MPKGVYKRTPEHNAAISAAKKGKNHHMYGKHHSEKSRKKMSEAHTGVPLSPEHCAAVSKGNRNSEAVKAKNERQCGVSLSPEACAIMSEVRLNSDAVKAVYETMRGGNDIIEHHSIYDHSDLTKYTMKMTRSQHAALHNQMRGLNIMVPHINTDYETEDELKMMKYIKKVENGD